VQKILAAVLPTSVRSVTQSQHSPLTSSVNGFVHINHYWPVCASSCALTFLSISM